MTPHISGSSRSAQARYAAGAREILESYFGGDPIRDEYLMAETAESIGLPPGVLNVVTADREVSELLVRDPRVDKIAFTGSTAAGRRIASICGERIARYTLELAASQPPSSSTTWTWPRRPRPWRGPSASCPARCARR